MKKVFIILGVVATAFFAIVVVYATLIEAASRGIFGKIYCDDEDDWCNEDNCDGKHCCGHCHKESCDTV